MSPDILRNKHRNRMLVQDKKLAGVGDQNSSNDSNEKQDWTASRNDRVARSMTEEKRIVPMQKCFNNNFEPISPLKKFDGTVKGNKGSQGGLALSEFTEIEEEGGPAPKGQPSQGTSRVDSTIDADKVRREYRDREDGRSSSPFRKRDSLRKNSRLDNVNSVDVRSRNASNLGTPVNPKKLKQTKEMPNLDIEMRQPGADKE
jgi:hypothetical protein